MKQVPIHLLLSLGLLLQCKSKPEIEIDQSIRNFPYGLVQTLPDIGDSNRIDVFIEDSMTEIRLQQDTIEFSFQEFLKYVSKDDSTEFTVKVNHDDEFPIVRHPRSGKPMDDGEIVTVMTYIMEKVLYHIPYGQIANMAGEPVDSVFVGMPVYLMAGDISGPWVVAPSSKIKNLNGYPTISPDSMELKLQNSNDRLFYTLFRLILKRYIGPQLKGTAGITYSPKQVSNIAKEITLVIHASSITTKTICLEIEKMGRILGLKTRRGWGAEE